MVDFNLPTTPISSAVADVNKKITPSPGNFDFIGNAPDGTESAIKGSSAFNITPGIQPEQTIQPSTAGTQPAPQPIAGGVPETPKEEYTAPGILTTIEKKDEIAKTEARVEDIKPKINPSQMTPEARAAAGLDGYDAEGKRIPGYKFDVFGNAVSSPSEDDTRYKDEAPVTADQQKIIDYENQLAQEQASIQAEMDSIKTQNDQLFNAQIDSIKQTFGQRKAEMETINKNSLAGQKLLGAVSGRTRYAKEIQSSIISNEERAGVSRIAEIDAQMNAAIIAAQQAKLDGDFKGLMLNMQQAETAYNQKRQLVMDLNTLSKSKNEELRAQAQESRENAKFIQEQSMNIGSMLAGSMLVEDENGNYNLPDDETINQMASDYGVDPMYFKSAMKSQVAEMANMEIESKKEFYEMQKTQKELAMMGMSDLQQEFEYAKEKYPEYANISFADYVKEQSNIKPPTSYQEWSLAGGKEGTNKSYAEFIGGQQGLSNQVVNQIDKVSTSFDSSPIVKQFNEVLNKKISVDAIIDGGVGGPRDLALVFDFMKALDPSSVVRETEYDSAAKSGNIFTGVFAKFNGYMREEGGFLPENVKNEFKDIIGSKFNAIESQYDNLRSEKARLIEMKTGGESGSDYLIDYKGDILGTSNESINWENAIAEIASLDSSVLKGLNEVLKVYPDMSDEELYYFINPSGSSGLTNGGSGTPTASVAKAFSVPNNTKGGECGRFVNQYTGLGVGDSMESKMAKMNPSIKEPKPGMVFVMDYSWTGHTGFIKEVKGDKVLVKDSNWKTKSAPQTVTEHWIDKDKIKGLTYA